MPHDKQILSPSENLLGRKLIGSKANKTWTVVEKLKKDPNSTGGNFSVGYIAHDAEGKRAFLKASDLNLLRLGSGNVDPLTHIKNCVNEQDFERSMLDICQGNNMDRIVHALDYGTEQTNENGIFEYLFYIIFEEAKGDVRSQVDQEKKQNMSWSLVALHNLAVAIKQLHTQNISHNDIKPSNLLVFDSALQILADLGRATADGHSGPWDQLPFCGDTTYAPPEFFYDRCSHIPIRQGKVMFDVRKASDLYLLGSMAFFLLTGESLTPLILKIHLRIEHHPNAWNGTYDDVVPYLEDALGRVFEIYLDGELPTDENGKFTKEGMELRNAIFSLCQPNVAKRGHPLNISSQANQFGLERYLSIFDRLSKKLILNERLKG